MHQQVIAMPGVFPEGDPDGQQALLGAFTALLAGLYRPAAGNTAAVADTRPDLPELLTAPQVTELTGISKSEVNRMLRDGRLPSLVAGAGAKYQKRWVSKAFVLRLLADLRAGVSIPSLREYSARWQASAAAELPARDAIESAGAA